MTKGQSMDQPLIWTTKGNLPVADLSYAARWEFSEETIKLIETYKLDDEVVKENAHICLLKGMQSDALITNLQ